MKQVADFASQELHWVQPSALHRAYELRAGDEVLASLRFRGGTLADVATPEGQWTFKRQGFWHQQVTVRRAGSDTDVAVFRPHWTGGGNLVAGDGTGLEFASASFWQSEWQWRQQDDVLVTYRRARELIKAEAEMEIAPGAAKLPNLGILVVLGWYLILLFGRDTAAQTASRSATVVTVMR